ncbi:restriction endonuclease subunit S [Actinobacillus pleuropneumoniae]|uniref:restriction endonuclease subunit S n=4 Tax=Actinobacillus pleuropneumoniae TaxID=715 RepID=UPI001EEED396|nr:restriction endonuclease subunit S [Actinobacillus pleuropneumoniae]
MKAQQLKNAILQLAIQGKLVPQDPTDEPASVFLEKIKQKKDRLIAEGKIKKSKKTSDKTPSTTEQDFPFEIPESWVWVRLEDIFHLQAGRFISASEIYGEYKESLYPCYGGNGLRGFVKTYNREGKFPIIGRQGALCGNINFAEGKFYSTEHAVVVETFSNTDTLWANYFLIQLNLNQYATATAQPGLAVNKINDVLIPLPPLNEQKRIVAKIEELLPYIEQYAEKEEKLTALHQQFPEQLKKSILQAAIQGKLTEQNPNDEPASALIERIKAEKLRLIAEKKLKKPKVISEIIMRDNLPYEIVNGKERCIADEVPFEIPESWVWVRLSEISKITMGQSPDNKYLGKEGIEFHQGKSFFSEYIIESSDIYCSLPNKLATPNSILLCVRAPVGIVNITNRELCIGRGLASIESIYVNTIFLYYALFCYKNYYERKSTGSTFKAISKDIIDNTIIPIPPLNEQIRIVEKIETLFSTLQNLSQK